MTSSSIKAITKIFENRLSKMTEENIIALSKTDNSIFNVVKGLHKEAFGTIVWNDDKPNFDYFILYTTRVNDKLEGFIFKLQPHLKIRNELTKCFALFVCQRFRIKDQNSIFNTYQDQQRSLFERHDFWTYDDTFKKELKGRRGELFLKGHKGILYVPFARTFEDEKEEIIKNKKESTKVKDEKEVEHFVYIMHNKHNNYYKIGRSINPVYREKTLQAQEPDVVLIDKWIASSEVEKILHRKFKDKKKRGEWFSLSENDIKEINFFMTDYSKTYVK